MSTRGGDGTLLSLSWKACHTLQLVNGPVGAARLYFDVDAQGEDRRRHTHSDLVQWMTESDSPHDFAPTSNSSQHGQCDRRSLDMFQASRRLFPGE